MLKRLFAATAVLSLSLFSGCAIHPLPEDVSGVPTHIIVRQIRCEVREAVIDITLDWLTGIYQGERRIEVDPESRNLGLEFRNGRRPIQTLSPKLFKNRTIANVIQTFFDTGVAYTFDLDMTEINNVDPQVDLLKIFPNAKLTIGVKGGLDRKRENERIFTVTDSFSGLVIKLPPSYCHPSDGRDYVVSKNYIYPITGKIGMQRMIEDFVELTLFENLGGPKDKPAGPPTLVDQLQFTTTISGSVTPTITFTPAGTRLQVMDASLPVTLSRTDLHKVTVGLALAGPGPNLIVPLRTSLFGALVTPPAFTTVGEQNAAAAVNQFLTLKIFQPTVTVVAP